MTEKITYLFGAGASYHALPLVKDIKDANGKITKHGLSSAIGNMGRYLKELTVNETNPLIETYAQDMLWLEEETKDFFTIDTLAKFFYEKGEDSNYDRLKHVLSVFIDIEQQINGKKDIRYLNLLVSLIDNGLPENVKFLTWNYDYQLELALEKFGKTPISFPKNSYHRNTNSEKINVFHLNGLAGIIANGRLHELIEDCKNIEEYFVRLNSISNCNKNRHFLHFAWENDFDRQPQTVRDRVHFATEIIKGTTILVVIGYSFPFFNRLIDKELFNTLKKGNLKKIYFQDPNLDGSLLYNQFEIDKTQTDIISIKDTSQFHVPFEL